MFLIIDFNATRRYSHHWSYLKKYQDLLSESGIQYQTWIPNNADDEIVTQLGPNCSRELRSNIYGFEKEENLYSWLLVKATDLFIKLCTKFLRSSEVEKIKKIASRIYIQKPFNLIKLLEISGEKITLVFPTMDSLAFRLAERCLNAGFQINRICFRLSSSHKDTYKVEEIETRLKIIISKYPNCKLALGYETMPHKEILIRHGIKETDLFWSPAPPEKELVYVREQIKTIKLGFLGVARPNKGFVEIPELINSLKSKGVSFKAYVQDAVYPWPQFLYAKDKLRVFQDSVKILSANLSDNELQMIFREIDVLVLPYNVSDYKYAGSGLLFTASDLGIPIVTKKGVAFEWDIQTYFLGFTYKDKDDFALKISDILLNESSYGFRSYNSDRRLAAVHFLGLEVSKNN